MSTWKEIGKGILKSSAVMYGSRIMADRVLPAAEDFGKKVWKKAKETKSTGQEKETQKPVKTQKVYDSSETQDLDYRDKESK